LINNLKKCEFGKESLVYLGHVIGGGEMKVDPTNVEPLSEWPTLTSVSEMRTFMGVAQSLMKFISTSSVVAHVPWTCDWWRRDEG
jgi:hypothetical protein